MIYGGRGCAYIIDNNADSVTENFAEGTDLIQSSVSYTLPNDVENININRSK